MKLKDKYVIKKIGSKYILTLAGGQKSSFNGIIKTNETGMYILELVDRDFTREQIIYEMSEKFNIDKTTARKDVVSFLDKLNEIM